MSVFAKKAIRRIEREIRFYCGPYVAEKVRKINQESTRYKEALVRLDKNINTSYSKISIYLADISSNKKSVNIEKIKNYKKIDPLKGQEKPGIIDFI